jgi:pimeloyl-ACP methyl ester carboxylesterase
MHSDRRRLLTAAAVVGLLDLRRRAGKTRGGPLPPAPAGSTTVVARDETRLHAQVGGAPESDLTVVFVHGFLARTIEFDMQWIALGQRARLVRYDHRSHGRSERSRRRFVDIDLLADDLVRVVEQLAPRGRLVLVGHSLGGMTILALARRATELFEDRVAGVALIGTRAGHFVPGHPVENTMRWLARHWLLAPLLALARLLAPIVEPFRPRRTSVLRAAIRRFLFGPADADPATVAMVQQMLEEPKLSVLAGFGPSLLRHDARPGLATLANVPVTVIAADSDHLAWPEHARAIAAGIGPHVELVLLPGVGHALNQTRPVEVNAALDRLLDRASPKTRSAAHDVA